MSWLKGLLRPAQPGGDRSRTPAAEAARSLAELLRVEDWRRIPRLVAFAFSPDPEVAATAAAALERLLAAVPLSSLPWLEKAVRRDQAVGWWNDRYEPAWRKLDPETLAAIGPALGPAVVSLCTFHPSGWVRAEGLAVLQTRFAPSALPFFVLRLSDWVPAIRSEAARWCEETLAPGHEAAWVRGLPLLDLVERSVRARSPGLRNGAMALFGTPAGRVALAAALTDPDILVRAFVFRRMFEAEPRSAEVLPAALRDRDLRIARLGAEELSPARFTPALAPALRAGLRSRLAYARRQCLDRLAETEGDGARAEILAGLRDRSGLVRGVAQFHAARLGLVPDLEAFHVGLLDGGPPSLVEVAISGLAELRRRAAWPRIEPFLRASSGRLRSAALRAGMELSPATMEPALWEALSSSFRSVSRLARALLASRPWADGSTRRALELATSTGEPDFVRLNAVRLLDAAPKWDQAIAWLQILARAGGPVSAQSLEQLVRWNRLFSRSSVRPTSEEMDAFEKALAAAEGLLPGGLRRQLELALIAWGRRPP
ncbi:MAG TPA: hypothetical protein VGG91_20835 [Myxococcaceae bacterium]